MTTFYTSKKQYSIPLDAKLTLPKVDRSNKGNA